MRNFHIFHRDQVVWAAFMRSPPYFGGRKNRCSRAQKAGLSYEKKAQENLLGVFPDQYVASPWIAFRLKGEPMLRYCQPDGLLFDILERKLTIVEIKLKHMVEAHTQLTGIYQPVVEHLFPDFRIRLAEVCRWYDPQTYFPVPVQMISDLTLAPHGKFAVHIWNP